MAGYEYMATPRAQLVSMEKSARMIQGLQYVQMHDSETKTNTVC